LGLEGRILFGNYIPDDELADSYRAADVFALSSRYEPFGMTAIEAMACGTPTVITTEGGLWNQITWGLEALYANPNDCEAFGHSLLEVLQYPQVSDQLAKYGSQKARARFTWTGVAQQLLGVFDTMGRDEREPAGGRRRRANQGSPASIPAEESACAAGKLS
jgi:mannosylfructose-phosphate synthase